MADSAITYTGIDEEFPVPGQDNDSQGFRDNFSQIKTGLETAKTELTDLLTSVARTDTANDFNGNNIEDIFSEIEEAQKGIQSNGNANMIFMDLSLKLTRLIQKQ